MSNSFCEEKKLFKNIFNLFFINFQIIVVLKIYIKLKLSVNLQHFKSPHILLLPHCLASRDRSSSWLFRLNSISFVNRYSLWSVCVSRDKYLSLHMSSKRITYFADVPEFKLTYRIQVICDLSNCTRKRILQ